MPVPDLAISGTYAPRRTAACCESCRSARALCVDEAERETRRWRALLRWSPAWASSCWTTCVPWASQSSTMCLHEHPGRCTGLRAHAHHRAAVACRRDRTRDARCCNGQSRTGGCYRRAGRRGCWRVLKSAARVAEEHATALLRDGTMEVDGARDENRLVHQTLAEGVWMLYDGVSEADRAVVVEVNRAESLRVIVVACDDVGDHGQRL